MKRLVKEINELVNKMTENSFLMPDSFSDVIDLQASEYSYKTYVGTRNLSGRYVNVYVYLDGKEQIEINFNCQKVTVKKEVEVNFNLTKILEIIQLIYNEKHSFANHNEGARQLRKSIRAKLDEKKRIESKIDSLKNELKGLLELEKSDK